MVRAHLVESARRDRTPSSHHRSTIVQPQLAEAPDVVLNDMSVMSPCLIVCPHRCILLSLHHGPFHICSISPNLSLSDVSTLSYATHTHTLSLPPIPCTTASYKYDIIPVNINDIGLL